MAYCRECGAYIPDGHTKCLACGYDETTAAPKAAAAGATKAASINTDAMREALERQLRQQRENTRKWAEAEHARRQQEQSRTSSAESERSNIWEDARDSSTYSADGSSRTLSVLSYIGVLCVVPFIACKDDKYAMFHAKQGLTLLIAGTAVSGLTGLVGLGGLGTLAWVLMAIKGIKNAKNGRTEKLPYIGDIADKL